tara:strand:+ start:578 stop:859 length:282 start_codon:yes stop_codon:yes gene_type:complete
MNDNKDRLDHEDSKSLESIDKSKDLLKSKVSINSNPGAKWIDNQGHEVEKVFGFNQNAELVNGRSAMIGFIMLVITEIIFGGLPVTKTIFGIG